MFVSDHKLAKAFKFLGRCSNEHSKVWRPKSGRSLVNEEGTISSKTAVGAIHLVEEAELDMTRIKKKDEVPFKKGLWPAGHHVLIDVAARPREICPQAGDRKQKGNQERYSRS